MMPVKTVEEILEAQTLEELREYIESGGTVYSVHGTPSAMVSTFLGKYELWDHVVREERRIECVSFDELLDWATGGDERRWTKISWVKQEFTNSQAAQAGGQNAKASPPAHTSADNH